MTPTVEQSEMDAALEQERTRRKTWMLTIVAMLVSVTVPIVGPVVGLATVRYAHVRREPRARNVLLGTLAVVGVYYLVMFPLTSVGPAS